MSGATGGQIGWLLAVAILCLSAGSGALVEAGSRRLSAANNKLQLCPSYFLIGAMKCGTSSMYATIRSQMNFTDQRKEIYAFSHDNPLPSRYGTKTNLVPDILDASPGYLHRTHTPKQIINNCSFKKPPKFLVSLCDPAIRAWSHFRFDVAMKHRQLPRVGIAKGFDDLVAKERDQVGWCLAEIRKVGKLPYKCSKLPLELLYSMYTLQLETWFKFFPRSSFLIVTREDWSVHMRWLMRAVSQHFGKPLKNEKAIEEVYIAHRSVGRDETPSKKTWSTLNTLYGSDLGWKKYVTPLSEWSNSGSRFNGDGDLK